MCCGSSVVWFGLSSTRGSSCRLLKLEISLWPKSGVNFFFEKSGYSGHVENNNNLLSALVNSVTVCDDQQWGFSIETSGCYGGVSQNAGICYIVIWKLITLCDKSLCVNIANIWLTPLPIHILLNFVDVVLMCYTEQKESTLLRFTVFVFLVKKKKKISLAVAISH